MEKNKSKATERYMAAWYRSEEDILAAARDARLGGLEIHDAFTPFPVHGLDDAIGLRRSRLMRVAFFGGLLGMAIAVNLQLWVSLSEWPMIIGGKPLAPIPLFVPVTFELTVLISGLSTVAAFLFVSRLRPGKRKLHFEGVTDNQFVLVLRQGDAEVDPARARMILGRHHASVILDGVEA